MRKTVSLAALAAVALPAFAQTNYEVYLASPIVRAAAGKLIYESVTVCQEAATNVQTRIYAETPADGFIHPEVFLLNAVTFGQKIKESFQSEYIQKHGKGKQGATVPACTAIQATLGKPDRNIEMFMGREGLKFQGRDEDSNQDLSYVVLWKDVYGR